MSCNAEPSGMKRLQPIKRRRFRTKSDVTPIFDDVATEEILSKDYSNLTLLEKAHLFRTKYPEKFESRQRDIERRDNEFIGVYETTPFLEEYYRRIRQNRVEAFKQRQEQKAKPRIITVEICYKEDVGKTTSILTLPNSPAIKKHQRNSSSGGILPRKSSNGSSELTVKVISGDCLFNGLDSSAERFTSCWVNVGLLPDGKSSPSIRKTPKSAMTCFGQASWGTKLSFKGYTPEQLQSKYLKFVVSGKWKNDKFCVGQAIMSGPKACISVENCLPRKARKQEMQCFLAAVKKPGNTFSANLHLYPEGPLGLRADDVTFTECDTSDESGSLQTPVSCGNEPETHEEVLVEPQRPRKTNRTTIRRKNPKSAKHQRETEDTENSSQTEHGDNQSKENTAQENEMQQEKETEE